MTSCLSTLCLGEIVLISLHHSAALLNNFCWARSRSSEFCTLLSSSNADRAPVQRQIKTQFGEVSRHILSVFRDCETHFNQLSNDGKKTCRNIDHNINGISILLNICTPSVKKNKCGQHVLRPFQLIFYISRRYRSFTCSYLLIYTQSVSSLLLFIWHVERIPLERTLQMCQDHEMLAGSCTMSWDSHKASFKPQGSADSGDNSMKIYHSNWPLPLCWHCHYKCIDCSTFKAVRVCDNWTTVILAIHYKS